jgi:lipid II:glycine glycyltransferase (peptidoglycan interpeptide bridge formation enzyme)
MKKKKLEKKLTLNKETIAGLNADEMKKIIGASVLFLCTDSCSVLGPCCGLTDTKKEKLING